MNDYYVYAYLREDGTPYYIGKGKGRRAYRNTGRTIQPPPKDRIKILLDNLTEEQAFTNETDFIKWYGRKDIGTGILWNLTDGGEGISGLIHSNKSRKKMSDSRRGKPGVKRSEEAKKKQSEIMSGRYTGKNNPFYGKTHSEETKKKIIEANKNRLITDETRLNISLSLKKRWQDMDARKKMSEKLKGRVCTDEHRRKQSESAKRRWQREKLKTSGTSLEKFLGNSKT
jgi:hypothetical protein